MSVPSTLTLSSTSPFTSSTKYSVDAVPVPHTLSVTISIVKQGWTLKKGQKAFNGFQKRYMVLYSNLQLDYYLDSDLQHFKGSVQLCNVEKKSVQRSRKVPNKQTYGFSIRTKKRTWYLAAHTEADRDDWIMAIRETLGQSPLHYAQSLTVPQAQKTVPNLPSLQLSETETYTQEVIPQDEVTSDYDAEDILAQLERNYNDTHYPERKGKMATGIEWSDDEDDEEEELHNAMLELGEEIDGDLMNDSLNESEPGSMNRCEDEDSLNETEDEEDTLNDTENDDNGDE